jgi:hypothetical protein
VDDHTSQTRDVLGKVYVKRMPTTTVIAVQPGRPLRELVRLVLARLERDGQVELEAPAADERRRRQLRRLHNRLLGRDDMEVLGGVAGDTAYLHARRPGEASWAFMGDLAG